VKNSAPFGEVLGQAEMRAELIGKNLSRFLWEGNAPFVSENCAFHIAV
jgi:hypothetical protein